MTQPDDLGYLQDMLLYSRKAVSASRRRHREELETDELLSPAMERLVEIVGEAATKVSSERKAALSDIPWREIVGMRNRLVHGYGEIDPDILWTVVTEDLPALVVLLEATLGRERGS